MASIATPAKYIAGWEFPSTIPEQSFPAQPALSSLERERLILAHLPQVRQIAKRIHARLPEGVSLDDLVSTGMVGLITAIDRFNPAQKTTLKTYAEYVIRGTILDSLRRLDWASRRLRRRAKQIDSAIAAAEQTYRRTPSSEEIALQLGISLAQYQEWSASTNSLALESLSSKAPGDESRELQDVLPSDPGACPSRVLEKKKLKDLLEQAVAKIPEMQGRVLRLLYYENLTQREVAKLVNLQESRVSQIKHQAIARLKTFMSIQWPVPRGI